MARAFGPRTMRLSPATVTDWPADNSSAIARDSALVRFLKTNTSPAPPPPPPGAVDSAGRRRHAVYLHEVRGERRIHYVSADVHRERQRPSGDVVRRTVADRRVLLGLEEVFGVGAERLSHRHDQRTGRIAASLGGECFRGAPDLDAGRREHVGERGP